VDVPKYRNPHISYSMEMNRLNPGRTRIPHSIGLNSVQRILLKVENSNYRLRSAVCFPLVCDWRYILSSQKSLFSIQLYNILIKFVDVDSQSHMIHLVIAQTIWRRLELCSRQEGFIPVQNGSNTYPIS
jgi:hypothetical protein